MLEMGYSYNDDCSLREVSFEGLTGLEQVDNVKEALDVMAVKSPLPGLMSDIRNGVYNAVSDEDYMKVMENMKCISALWHYEGEPVNDKNGEFGLNPLTLLANALELISEQNTELRKYRSEWNPEDEILREVFTKQTDMMAEELRQDVLLRAFRYTEYRFKWELYTREEKSVKDASRRMAHNAFVDSVNIFVRYLRDYGIAKPEPLGSDRQKNGDLACRIVCGIGIGNR